MGYAFISYSRQDARFVDRLAADLRSAGVELWRDTDSILPGQEWANEIARSVSRAEALIYVASRHSVTSEWMNKEIEFAFAQKSRIIPLVIDDDAPHNLPPFMAMYQWVDFRRDYGAALDQLLRGLPDSVRSSAPRQPQPQPPKSKGYAFLSFAEEDAPFVKQLRRFIEARKYVSWDYLESDRNYHVEFHKELQSIIREASVTLSILSPAWADSDWTAKEYQYSVAVKVPVILLKAREFEPQLILMNIPYIDFSLSMTDGFDKLDKELRHKGLID